MVQTIFVLFDGSLIVSSSLLTAWVARLPDAEPQPGAAAYPPILHQTPQGSQAR
jgi:hypothetical protein